MPSDLTQWSIYRTYCGYQLPHMQVESIMQAGFNPLRSDFMGDLKDVAARIAAAKAKEQQEKMGTPTEYDYDESYRLRGKMLGVLIRDARLNAARTVEDCARLLSIEPALVEAWEYGDDVPSLPQLELLAYYLDVPVSHFWSMETIETDKSEKASAQSEYMQLRDRMIGALLRQAREEAGLELAEVAEQSRIAVEILEQYELGDVSIPMSELSMFSSIVNRNVDYFLETSSYIGELLKIQAEWKRFTDLDPEIREFAANPLNVAFIKIAITFSKMPVDQLRKAAEGLLEIAM
ncbi:MAG: helix-turn-helix domain-containing protein [Anaerolineae bacterium]|nr:helix-turn-helix domain-containing protein [Anaerolineae bacterium]